MRLVTTQCTRCFGIRYELDPNQSQDSFIACPYFGCQRVMQQSQFRRMIIHANNCNMRPRGANCWCLGQPQVPVNPSWPEGSLWLERRRQEESNQNNLHHLEADTRWINERGLYKCVICLDDQKTAPELVIIANCGHACMCVTCAQRYTAPTCPMCRAEIKSICNLRLVY